MMLFGLVGCVFWVPLLAVAILCFVVLYRSLSSPGVVAPQCGGCGYAVADIPGTTCPECGRSLLTVGVATRSLVGRYRSSMLLAQLSWLGVWGGVSVVASWIVWWIWLMSATGGSFGGGAVAMTGMITPTGTATHLPVSVDVNSTGWGQIGTVAFSVSDADGVLHEIELDGSAEPLSATVWSDGNEVWSDSSTPIRAALDEWFAAAGVDDATDPDDQSRADLDMYASSVVANPMGADQVQFVMSSSSLTVTNASGTAGQMAAGFAGGGGGLVWAAVGAVVVLGGYVIGVVLIARRRAKLMRLV
ncbi:MAG: hypothetical protein AAFY46_02635 [Planctomycetota bacterium]